jgi:hypothetical protein
MRGRIKWDLDKAVERIVERVMIAPVGDRIELIGAVTIYLVNRLRVESAREQALVEKSIGAE